MSMCLPWAADVLNQLHGPHLESEMKLNDPWVLQLVQQLTLPFDCFNLAFAYDELLVHHLEGERVPCSARSKPS